MENQEILELTTSAWREKVYIETAEYIIRGYVFMPKIGKKSRLLSDILNTNKQFIAVKNCTLESKLVPQREIEKHDFLQVNISTILMPTNLSVDDKYIFAENGFCRRMQHLIYKHDKFEEYIKTLNSDYFILIWLEKDYLFNYGRMIMEML